MSTTPRLLSETCCTAQIYALEQFSKDLETFVENPIFLSKCLAKKVLRSIDKERISKKTSSAEKVKYLITRIRKCPNKYQSFITLLQKNQTGSDNNIAIRIEAAKSEKKIKEDLENLVKLVCERISPIIAVIQAECNQYSNLTDTVTKLADLTQILEDFQTEWVGDKTIQLENALIQLEEKDRHLNQMKMQQLKAEMETMTTKMERLLEENEDLKKMKSRLVKLESDHQIMENWTKGLEKDKENLENRIKMIKNDKHILIDRCEEYQKKLEQCRCRQNNDIPTQTSETSSIHTVESITALYSESHRGTNIQGQTSVQGQRSVRNSRNKVQKENCINNNGLFLTSEDDENGKIHATQNCSFTAEHKKSVMSCVSRESSATITKCRSESRSTSALSIASDTTSDSPNPGTDVIIANKSQNVSIENNQYRNCYFKIYQCTHRN